MDKTEEETIKRVARSMFGNNLEFTPQVMELIKGLYRKFLEDMGQQTAVAQKHPTGDPVTEQAA